MTTALTETTCQTCGGTFHYEPVIIFGRDLARPLHLLCEPCKLREAAEDQEKRGKERIRHLADRWRATVPPDLQESCATHPTFNRPLWNVIKDWGPCAGNRSLGIIGPAARRKTRVMAMLAKRVFWQAHGQTACAQPNLVWTSAVKLKDAATDRYSRDRHVSTAARELLSDCLKTPWLFLDDLGKNEWSPAFESQLFQILDHRVNHQLTTVWSANAHPEDFAPMISPLNAWPIIGRLLDRCTLLDLREE